MPFFVTHCDRIVTEVSQNAVLQSRFQIGIRSFLTPPRGPKKEAHTLKIPGRLKCSNGFGFIQSPGKCF